VNPDALERVSPQLHDAFFGSGSNSLFAHLLQVERVNCRFTHILTAKLLLLFGIAVAEQHNVLITHERAQSVNVCENIRTSPGDDGQVH
jgi:hypothetical protein